jgi:hypothetical protein
MRSGLLLVVVLPGCGFVDFSGEWLGACETPALGMQVDVLLLTTGDDSHTEYAQVTVARPDRPGLVLGLRCATIEQDGRDALVTDCEGAWEGELAPHDFLVSGRLERGDLVDELHGDCTIDGLDGDAELWRIP